jgi:hypothetical protein
VLDREKWDLFVTLHGNWQVLCEWAGPRGERLGLTSGDQIIEKVHTRDSDGKNSSLAVLVAPREKIRRGLSAELLEDIQRVDRKATTVSNDMELRQTSGVGNAPAVENRRLQRTCRLKVDLVSRNIYLDGEPIPHTSILACEIVQRLIDADGGIMPPDKLLPDDKANNAELKDRVRDAMNHLDPSVRRLVGGKSGQGGGRFLRPDAFELR